MRAAVVTEAKGFEVVDVDDPTPGPGELVLQVLACGICGSDLKAHTMMRPGAVLGHEFCGEVVAAGADADAWRPGELVAALPMTACGRCRWCVADQPAHCDVVDYLGVGGSAGGFAEYVRVAASSAVRLASGLGEHGALVEPLAVGLHAVAAADIRTGDRVLVLGGGNVGAAVAIWARRLGAGEVVVSDPVAARRDTADRFGATGVHDPADGPIRGFDVVIECTGIPGMIQAAIAAAGVLGRVVIAGVCTGPDEIQPLVGIMTEVQVRFAVYYRQREFIAAAQFLADGGVDVDTLVTKQVPLDGIGGAFDLLHGPNVERKVLITPNR